MMQDRWPPEPPRAEPPRSTRLANALLLVLLAGVALAVLLGAIYWSALAVGAFHDLPGS